MTKNLIYLFCFFLISCGVTDDVLEPSVDPEVIETFGIRHDKTLWQYEKIASNEAPFNTGDYPDFSSVVSLEMDISKNDVGICSGVLIAPNWVLTAGHCVYDYDTDKSPMAASKIKVNVGNDPENPIQTVNVQQIFLAPSWLAKGDFFVYGNDLCLLKLASPITKIPMATLNYDTSSEKVNAELWFSGFGDYSQQKGQNADVFSKKHAYQNILDRVKEGLGHFISNETYTGGMLAFDFDDPAGLVNTLGDSYANEEERSLGEGSSQNVCLTWEGGTVEGDSGGPIFMKINNKWVVIGILNGGVTEPLKGIKDSGYGDISTFTKCSSHANWIKSILSKN